MARCECRLPSPCAPALGVLLDRVAEPAHQRVLARPSAPLPNLLVASAPRRYATGRVGASAKVVVRASRSLRPQLVATCTLVYAACLCTALGP